MNDKHSLIYVYTCFVISLFYCILKYCDLVDYIYMYCVIHYNLYVIPRYLVQIIIIIILQIIMIM